MGGGGGPDVPFRGSTSVQPATEPCLGVTSVIAGPRRAGGILRMLLNPKPATALGLYFCEMEFLLAFAQGEGQLRLNPICLFFN